MPCGQMPKGVASTTGCRPATQTTASPVTTARPWKSKGALSAEASAQALGNQVERVGARPAGLEPAAPSLEGSPCRYRVTSRALKDRFSAVHANHALHVTSDDLTYSVTCC